MRFTNLTRRTEIGANSYFLEIAGKRVVLDVGMHPKAEGDEAAPALQLLPEAPLDAIFVSHAHQDHIGSLPLLCRRQPEAPVFMTEPTRIISDVMLHNSVNVMTRIREEKKYPNYPLFTHREVEKQARRWQARSLRRQFNLTGDPADDAEVSFEFFDAGHILGSAGILMRGEGRTVFYTGDVNLEDQTVSRAADFPRAGVDVLIIETTRGDAPQREGYTRGGEALRLGDAINAAFERDGCVLVPLFALGKTQEVLVMLHELQQSGHLPGVPIYIGGLSAKLTEIYDRLASQTPRRHAGFQIMDSLAPFVLSGQTAEHAPIKPNRIYALSSGMMTENTGSNLFARRVLENDENSILFVGYSDPESPAGILQKTPAGEEVVLDGKRPPQRRRCHIEPFTFSAHSSRESLRKYVRELRPKTIVLVHGDPPAVEWFHGALAADLPESRVIVPPPGVPIDL